MCKPTVEDFFWIDDPASLSKLQGPQYAIIWLEEPAPIIEKQNAGPHDIIGILTEREVAACTRNEARLR